MWASEYQEPVTEAVVSLPSPTVNTMTSVIEACQDCPDVESLGRKIVGGLITVAVVWIIFK